MSGVNFVRLNELFDRAVALPPEQRDAFVDSSCADDPKMAAEVRAMLVADAEVGHDFLTLSKAVAVPKLLGETRLTPPPTIGAYRIVREIGRGGMGVVYEAEQDDPKRRVAVKVVRQGFVNDELRARFRREARALGQLRHAGIAHIYEAGSARIGDESWPFFAMEYIEGERLDRYVEAADVAPEERIALVAQVCDAVEHAHRHGVVHRDLKPANILIVDDADGARQAKILDFGVARITDSDAKVTTLHTNPGEIVGTVGYMAPEQLAGADIDARADVYALGVLLFRLLSGRMPYDIRGKPITEVVRLVHDEEPTRIASVDRRWRGDVDTILTKALEREPARRYASAAELAADLRHFLADEPVVARAPSTWYRARKFARRNKGLVVGLTATFMALVVGLVVATSAFVSANRERAAKEAALADEQRSRRTAEAVTGFLAEMIGAASPERQGKDVSLRTVLEGAGEKVESEFADQPLVRARLSFTIARTYVSLGDYELAATNAKRAIEIWEELVGPGDPRTLKARELLGETQYFLGRRGDAAATMERTHRDALAAFGPDHERTVSALANVAFIRMRMGRVQEAEATYREVLAAYEKRPDTEPLEMVHLKSNIAVLYTRLQRFDEAEVMYKEVITFATKSLGAEHPETLLTMANLAAQYNRTARWDLSVPLLEKVLDAQERVLGDTHSKTLISRNNLAVAYTKLGRWDRGEKMIRDGLAKANETYGPKGPSTLMLTHSLGRLLRQRGDLEGAERILVRSLALHEEVFDDTGPARLKAEAQMVELRLDQRRFDDAIELAKHLDVAASESPRRNGYRVLLARAYLGAKRSADAERVLVSIVEGQTQPDQAAVKMLVELLEAAGRAEEASAYSRASKPSTSGAR